jgi:hypothetical protein
MATLRKGDHVPEVARLQQLLKDRGFQVAVDGEFGLKTKQAVQAFQSQDVDPHGEPLIVDGIAGPLTWWSLTHAKSSIVPASAVDYALMPQVESGGSQNGRRALGVAIDEMKAGAGEIGGNNRGPYVVKYLNGLAPEGSSWCAAFVSWCFAQDPTGIPFRYTVGARDLLSQLKKRGWAREPGAGYQPEPGDIVIWWRVRADGWQGHTGLVHQVRDGRLYTVEGNRLPQVRGFSYVLSRIDKRLGYGHVPD